MDIRRYGFIAAAGLIAVAAPVAARSQATPAVDKAVAAWKKVRSLSGSFEQTLTNPLLRTTTTARGSFRQQLPNRLSVRFSDPAGDAIVADGKHLWVYLQQAAPGQVMKLPMTNQMAMPIDIGQFLDSPASKYDISIKGTDDIGGRKAQALGLSPKRGTTAPFRQATVWVDDADGLIRQFEVVESSGLVRRIRLTKVAVNPSMTAADFRFAVPKGVRVVDR